MGGGGGGGGLCVGMSSSCSGVGLEEGGGRMVTGEEDESEGLGREESSLEGGGRSIEVAVTQMQTMPARNPDAE